jgi:ribosome biogenesis ATPase
MLRSLYAVQTPKRSQQLEIEVVAEKPRRLIMADGGGGGDAKPEAALASEGFGRGDKGPRFADLGGMEAVIEELMMEVWSCPCAIRRYCIALALGRSRGCCCQESSNSGI